MSALDALFAVAPHLLENARPSSNHIMVNCPFHGENTPSMAISTWKPLFFCHGCKASGHIAQLLRKYGMSREMVDVLLPRRHYTKEEKDQGIDGRPLTVAAKIIKGKDPFRGNYILEEAILDEYRLMPSSLHGAGYRASTLRHFEVGFDTSNLRITYPLRTVFGELVGISGRAAIDGVEPRYKIYDRELKSRRDYKIPDDYSMEEQKSSILWHAHIVRPLFFLKDSTDEAFVITEGFKACMWTWQAGCQDTVALVGSYLTPAHAEIIARATRKVTLFLDNNDAGWNGTKRAGKLLLSKGVDVSVAYYPDDREQPDDLTADEVLEAVDLKESFRQWSASHILPDSPQHLLKKIHFAART